MCNPSLTGIRKKIFGSRFSLPFLSALLLFSAFSLSAQSQVQGQTQYSGMTREQLLTVISDKDSLLQEWLTWSEKEKALKKEQDEAYKEQLASRDKLIRDQGIVIEGYKQQEALTWLERTIWGLGGAGIGFVGGHFTR